jgi:hypothetical protein
MSVPASIDDHHDCFGARHGRTFDHHGNAGALPFCAGMRLGGPGRMREDGRNPHGAVRVAEGRTPRPSALIRSRT